MSGMVSFKKILQLFSFCLGIGSVISQSKFFFMKKDVFLIRPRTIQKSISPN